ncbi:uncharacterized protein LOC109533067 [Dendroctonus ponderosae]|uniref:uncharacterized protein LOC109533067 n=1 Tax=Dendroctonus ponderosae TaxID=77166 RepID=UPI002035B6AA|nr:uncharacterized protein LOC109533067 [Dendroctonus ponderosae]
MNLRIEFLVIVYLSVTVTAMHEPQVYEELDEQPPVYKRTARHLGKSESTASFQPPAVSNYQPSQQQDRLKSRYDRQQQADFRNLRRSSDSLAHRHPVAKSFHSDDANNDWKPFQPSFLYPSAPKPATNSYRRSRHFSQSLKTKEILRGNKNAIDSAAAGSEHKEELTNSERQDQQTQLIYISPNTLKDKLGLDAKTSEEIIQKSIPGNENPDAEQFQLTDLQELLGKNPAFQLQGLQRLLEDGKPVVENSLPVSNVKDISSIHIQHNGTPSLETLQQQIDAVNKAQEEEVLAAAQKQAEAHVHAQHQAIALAQKKAQEEAFAKIAAHNQGLSTLSAEQLQGSQIHSQPPENGGVITINSPSQESIAEENPREIDQEIHQNAIEHPQQTASVEQPEVSALQGRPLDQLIVNPVKHYGGSYASSLQDLRNVKPRIQGARGIIYRPVALANSVEDPAKLQYLSAVPPLYNPKDIQNYSPVSPYTPHLSAQSVYTKTAPQPTEPTIVNLLQQEQIRETYQPIHVSPSPATVNQLYSEEPNDEDEHQQYAAKYAFGYRILDEKHGNDFGHEEERNGKLTKGHYYVRLPDGRKQRVDYYADKSGYHARVRYENVGKHPYNPVESAEESSNLQTVHHQ